jgi:hypothetical protein
MRSLIGEQGTAIVLDARADENFVARGDEVEGSATLQQNLALPASGDDGAALSRHGWCNEFEHSAKRWKTPFLSALV